MDLERVIPSSFSDDNDTNTISGLFMRYLNRMPRPGDEIVQSKMRFLVLDVINNRAGAVQIYPMIETEIVAEIAIKEENDLVLKKNKET